MEMNTPVGPNALDNDAQFLAGVLLHDADEFAPSLYRLLIDLGDPVSGNQLDTMAKLMGVTGSSTAAAQ